MAICDLCDNEMNSGESCVEHTILLETGEEIDSPRHNESGSLSVDMSVDSDQCPDCGVEVGGIHHPRCDWARIPDTGEQALMHSTHWPAEETA